MNLRQMTTIWISVLMMSIVILINMNTTSEKVILSSFVITLPFLLYQLLFRMKFLSASFFFVTFYIMLFYIQPIYFLFSGISYTHFSVEVIRIYSILSNAGVLLFLVGVSLVTHNKMKLQKVYMNKKSVDKTIKLLFIIMLISVMFAFVDAGTFNIMNLSRAELKNNTSILRLFSTFGFYVTSILFFLVFFTYRARRKSNVLMWFIIFILVEILIFMLFRTRSLTVAHSASLIIGLYYSSSYAYNKYSSIFSSKISILMSAVIIFVFAISSRFLRGYLQPTSNVNNFDFNLSLFLEKSILNGDIGYSNVVMRAIEYSVTNNEFLNGQSYYRLLFTGIPRSIWQDKPENTQQIVAGWLEPSVLGLSLPPGIIGDAFINFGILGIFSMVLFGLFFGILDRKIYIKNFLIWGTSVTWVFHLVRGGFTNPILIFMVLLITIFFINRYFLKYDKEHEVSIKNL